MNVSAVIVTRGDVDLSPVLNSLPRHWEKVVVDNSREPQDFKVYGRFVGVQRASHSICFVQDDDCVIEQPQELVDAWVDASSLEEHNGIEFPAHVVCNMPANFRHSFYQEHALIGFGGVFHKHTPDAVFRRLLGPHGHMTRLLNNEFLKCCDIAFTALSPRVLVDVPYRDLAWASAPNRMWTQPDHRSGRAEFLRRVLAFKDKEDRP